MNEKNLEILIDRADTSFESIFKQWYPDSVTDEQKEEFQSFYLKGFIDGYKTISILL